MTPRRLFEVATRARELLERDGWQQGGFGRFDGPKCEVGLIAYAVDPLGGFLRSDVYLAIRPAIMLCNGNEDPVHAGVPPVWNDAPGRTIDDVRSALDALASLALGEMAAEEAP